MFTVQMPQYCWRIWTLLQHWVAQHQIQAQRRRKLQRRPLPHLVSSNSIFLPAILCFTHCINLVKRKLYVGILEMFMYLFVCAGAESSIPESADDLSARATLIISPLSVLSNWLVGRYPYTTNTQKRQNLSLKSFYVLPC